MSVRGPSLLQSSHVENALETIICHEHRRALQVLWLTTFPMDIFSCEDCVDYVFLFRLGALKMREFGNLVCRWLEKQHVRPYRTGVSSRLFVVAVFAAVLIRIL